MSQTVDTEQVEALSKAVLSIDGARRVGWAKAFSAVRQLESTSQDLNIAQGDRVLFLEKLSYLWGITDTVLRHSGRSGRILAKMIRDDVGMHLANREDNAILDTGYVSQGRSKAKAFLEVLAEHGANTRNGIEGGLADIRAEKSRKRARRVSVREGVMRDARVALIRSYGVRSEEELREAVTFWRGRHKSAR